ncbi:hypothetical protein HPB51_019256 [Rhipicephalus microplus]|uniref:Uncharacterized protein n=1 Tax=Rhipicephalus microplus TaxID=6941 RepID=A0A9J6F5D8_RHIMP|nr:hypothetical protein HPB51_019256 [Rhipicephalus microplus]
MTQSTSVKGTIASNRDHPLNTSGPSGLPRRRYVADYAPGALGIDVENVADIETSDRLDLAHIEGVSHGSHSSAQHRHGDVVRVVRGDREQASISSHGDCGDLQEEQRGTSTFSWDASLLASSASFFWVLLDVLFKLNPSIPTPKLLFHFSEGIFVGSMTLMSGIAEPYGPLRAQSLLFMRSVAMTGAHFARLFSLRFLSVVDAFTISSLGPVLSELPTCANRKGATVGRVLPLCMGAISLGLLGYSKQYRAPDTTSGAPFRDRLLAHADCLGAARRGGPVQRRHVAPAQRSAGVPLFVRQPDRVVSFAYLFSLTKARNLEYYGVVNVFAYGLDAFLSLAASHLVLDEVPGRHSDLAALLVMAAVMIVEACRIGQLHIDSCSHQTWWLVLNLPVLSPPKLQSPAS